MNAKSLSRAVAGGAVLSAAIAVGASGSGGRFVEPDVQVLHQFDGAGPNASAYFGWAVSELGDVDGDHVDRRDRRRGVQRSRLGHRRDVRLPGPHRPPDLPLRRRGRRHQRVLGRRRRRHRPRPRARHPRRLARERARPRRSLLRPHGRAAPPVHGRGERRQFGWSVSSAGDVDRDHRADVLVGASQPGGVGPGYATIYSGGPTRRSGRSLAARPATSSARARAGRRT